MIPIAEIASANTALNDADNELAVAIRGIETLLHAHIGTRIELKVDSEKFTRLAFGKLDGAWHLLVEHGGKWNTLLGSPRDLRASALSGGHVKRLVVGAADQIRNQIVSRRLAASAANELLILLNTSPGEES